MIKNDTYKWPTFLQQIQGHQTKINIYKDSKYITYFYVTIMFFQVMFSRHSFVSSLTSPSIPVAAYSCEQSGEIHDVFLSHQRYQVSYDLSVFSLANIDVLTPFSFYPKHCSLFLYIIWVNCANLSWSIAFLCYASFNLSRLSSYCPHPFQAQIDSYSANKDKSITIIYTGPNLVLSKLLDHLHCCLSQCCKIALKDILN